MNGNAYIKRNSFLHRLNPSIKILGFIAFIAMIFMPLGFFVQTILILILTSLYFFAKLPKRLLWNILKSVLILFALLLLINWAIYKTPIAINLPEHISIWMGSDSLIDQASSSYIWLHANNTYVSQIWGGTNPEWITINGINFQGQHFSISEIISQNYIQQKQVMDEFNALSLDAQHQFIKLAHNNKLLAAEFNWVINNQWTLQINNMTYKFQTGIVSNPNWVQTQTPQAFYFQTLWYTFSPRAIELALFITLKVYLIIILSTLLTTTTTSIELTYALEDLLSPLKIFKLPVNEASMMIAIALRFIPSLLAESKRIMNAQASRGVDFKNGNFIDKNKALVSLVVPLFSIAFSKAEELANAMDARAYNPRYARTRYRVFNLTVYDWIGFFLLVFLFGILIGFCIVHIIFTPFGLFEAATMYS